MKKIAILYGSSRPSKVGQHVAKWVENNADFSDVETELINLEDQNLPIVPEATSPMMVENRNYQNESIQKWSDKISEFDGYIIINAEYNLGYTPLLKNAIDVLFHEWTGKAVAYISYGSYPKSTSTEQLRVVMSAFKSNQVEPTVHISPSYKVISEDGQIDSTGVSGDLNHIISDFKSKL